MAQENASSGSNTQGAIALIVVAVGVLGYFGYKKMSEPKIDMEPAFAKVSAAWPQAFVTRFPGENKSIKVDKDITDVNVESAEFRWIPEGMEVDLVIKSIRQDYSSPEVWVSAFDVEGNEVDRASVIAIKDKSFPPGLRRVQRQYMTKIKPGDTIAAIAIYDHKDAPELPESLRPRRRGQGGGMGANVGGAPPSERSDAPAGGGGTPPAGGTAPAGGGTAPAGGATAPTREGGRPAIMGG